MSVEITFKANPQELVASLYGNLVDAAWRVLKENIIPQEPIDTSSTRDATVMREHTHTEVKVVGGGISVVFFVGSEIWYSWYTEFPETHPSLTYGPRTPGTRMPWLKPGVQEGMPIIIKAAQDALKDWSG